MKPAHSKDHQLETSLTIELRSDGCREVQTSAINRSSQESLNVDERRQLEKCEEIIRKGLGTFFEVGQALLTIRETRLYRENFPTFEVYCQQRWAIGRNYAWHLMGAAERIKLLPPDAKTPRPLNEFQVRPFLKLEPELFPKAWEQVISKAKDGKITPALLRGVVTQMTHQRQLAQSNRRKPRKATRLPKGCSVGGILVLLDEAKKAMEKGDTAKAIQTIERLESEVLGMCH
jgi:hypothetical protein